MHRRQFLASSAAFALSGPLSAFAAEGPLDLALINASVWTGRPGARPSAVGIAGDRIVILGAGAVRERTEKSTRVIDLQGAFVMSAFTDNHTHFLIGSAQLSQAAIPRFAKQHVIPSVQPYHAIDDGRWAVQRIGEKRLKGTYAFRSLLDAGATMTFGSDWPVAPLDPLLGIYAAATRRTIDDANPEGWLPDQKITVEQAMTCYTRHNAYAGFMDDRSGQIAEGYLADLVVLDSDLLAIDPPKIPAVKVLRTFVGGRQRFGEE